MTACCVPSTCLFYCFVLFFLLPSLLPPVLSQSSLWTSSLRPSHTFADSWPGPPVVQSIRLSPPYPRMQIYHMSDGLFSHLPNLFLFLSQGKLPRRYINKNQEATQRSALSNETLLILVLQVWCLECVIFCKSAPTLQISESRFPADPAPHLPSFAPSFYRTFSSVSRRPLPRLKAKPSPIRTPRRTRPGWPRVSSTWCAPNAATASTCTATDPGRASTSAPSTRGRPRTAPGSAHKTGWWR